MPLIPLRDRPHQCLTPSSAHGVREARRKVLAAKWCKAIDEALSDPTRAPRDTWPFYLSGANEAIAAVVVDLYKAAGWCAFVAAGGVLLSEFPLSDDGIRRALEAPAIKLDLKEPRP